MHFLFYYYFSKIFTFFLKKDLNIVKFNIIITLTKDEIAKLYLYLKHIAICCFTDYLPTKNQRMHFPNGGKSICIEYDKNLLKNYSKDFTKSDMSIEMLNSYILMSKKVNSNNKKDNIKHILTESSVIIMSIGLNDLLYKITLSNQKISTINNIVDEVYNDLKNLLKEINKYSDKICIVGYYESRKYNYKISERANESLRQRELVVRKQRTLVVVIVLTLISLGILLGTSVNAMASSKSDVASYYKYYTSIRVEAGDTLWDIAKIEKNCKILLKSQS